MKTQSWRTIIEWIKDHTHGDKEFYHISPDDNIQEKLKGFRCRVCEDTIEMPIRTANTIPEVEKLVVLTCKRDDYKQAKEIAKIIKMFRMLD